MPLQDIEPLRVVDENNEEKMQDGKKQCETKESKGVKRKELSSDSNDNQAEHGEMQYLNLIQKIIDTGKGRLQTIAYFKTFVF